MKGGQKMSPLLAFVTDIDSVGLETAQGLLLAEAFYWDLNDDTRAFSKRFMERIKRVPTSAQAGVYSSVTHYLQGGEGRRHHRFGRRHEDHEGDPDQRHVRQERPDPRGRPHGARHVSVRGQEAVGIKGRWDDYKLLATVPGNEAFQSLELSRCPLVKK